MTARAIVRPRMAAFLMTAALLVGCTGSGGGTIGSGGPTGSGDDGVRPGSSSSAVSAAPTPALDRFYGQRLSWRDCKDGFQCTRLLVPVDYADPTAGTLRVAVIRKPATGDRKGSLLVNPGGPGASGIDYARGAASIVSKAVRAAYDIVGFDPRGVASSAGIQCLTDSQLDTFVAYDGSPDDQSEEQGLVEQGKILGAGCEKAAPALLPHLGTRDAARDLDVLRAALGDRRLSYLGKSYGTYLGATYAGLFPRRVGRLVLDGPLDPASTSLEVAQLQGVGFERALNAFFDDCLRRSSCPFEGTRSDARARLSALLDSIDASPLPGEGGRELSQSLAVLGVAAALYNQGNWSFLRQGLRQALRGNGLTLMLLANFYSDRGPGGKYKGNGNEVIYAVNCVDRPTPGDLETFRAEAAASLKAAPIFGPYIVWGNLPCTTWPVPPVADPAPIHAPGARPILVVGTTRDPATPYEWALALSSELDSGHLLTYVGDGHTAYRRGSGCIDAAVDSYLLRGTLPADGLRCR